MVPNRFGQLHLILHVTYEVTVATAPPSGDVPDPQPMLERFERRYAGL